ncbi:unnamed protein product [Boreogadus saida]
MNIEPIQAGWLRKGDPGASPTESVPTYRLHSAHLQTVAPLDFKYPLVLIYQLQRDWHRTSVLNPIYTGENLA